MGRYSIDIGGNARKQLAAIYESGRKADIKRIEIIMIELADHPQTGTGKPEQLKYQLSNFWSRRINTKDRLIYLINDLDVVVTIVSAKGHYTDK